jgi:hypothetical protein
MTGADRRVSKQRMMWKGLYGAFGSKRPLGNNFRKTRSADRSITSGGKSRQHSAQNEEVETRPPSPTGMANKKPPTVASGSASDARQPMQIGLREPRPAC